MGIRFACEKCGHVMHVKDELAGRRGFCDFCQAKVVIPQSSTVEKVVTDQGKSYRMIGEPTAPPVQGQPAKERRHDHRGEVLENAEQLYDLAPVGQRKKAPPPKARLIDPIAQAPHAQWYVLPASASTPFGPAAGSLFSQWIAQGRVGPDSMVWREDWADWRRAVEVLPQLNPTVLPPIGTVVTPTVDDPLWDVPNSEPLRSTSDDRVTPAQVTVFVDRADDQRRKWRKLIVLAVVTAVLAIATQLVLHNIKWH